MRETEGSPYTHGDPSVSRSTKSKGVLLDPPTARSAVVSYFIGEAQVKNTVLDADSRTPSWTVFSHTRIVQNETGTTELYTQSR